MKNDFPCPYCGYNNSVESNFCNKCGKKIIGIINKNVGDNFFEILRESYKQFLSDDIPNNDKVPFFISNLILDKAFCIFDKIITQKNKYYNELFLNTYVMMFILLYIEIRLICLSINKNINNEEKSVDIQKVVEFISAIFRQFILYAFIEYTNHKNIDLNLYKYNDIDEWYKKYYSKYIDLICDGYKIDYNEIALKISEDICNDLNYRNIYFDDQTIYQIFKNYIVHIDTYLKFEVNKIFSSKLYLWLEFNE